MASDPRWCRCERHQTPRRLIKPHYTKSRMALASAAAREERPVRRVIAQPAPTGVNPNRIWSRLDERSVAGHLVSTPKRDYPNTTSLVDAVTVLGLV
jgi:hypothetical protein